MRSVALSLVRPQRECELMIPDDFMTMLYQRTNHGFVYVISIHLTLQLIFSDPPNRSILKIENIQFKTEA